MRIVYPTSTQLAAMKKAPVFIVMGGSTLARGLTLANNSLDYLVRTNIADELQGRAWGLIGFLSQIGYVVAYGFSGLLADGIGSRLQIGVGRGSALVIIAAGALLALIALSLYPIRSIRLLEKSEA